MQLVIARPRDLRPISGTWRSREESLAVVSIEWAKRIPFELDPRAGAEPEVELRRLFELEAVVARSGQPILANHFAAWA